MAFLLAISGGLASFIETKEVMAKADSEDLNEYLVNINATFCHFGNLEMEARWDYITDITTEHENEMVLTSVGSNHEPCSKVQSSVTPVQKWQ